jgi:hypothetical protein
MLDGPEDTMMRSNQIRELAAYGISMPVFAVSPKLAKETVYMPSQIAERLLGRGAEKLPPERESDEQRRRTS